MSETRGQADDPLRIHLAFADYESYRATIEAEFKQRYFDNFVRRRMSLSVNDEEILDDRILVYEGYQEKEKPAPQNITGDEVAEILKNTLRDKEE